MNKLNEVNFLLRNKIAIFEGRKIRRHWDGEKEKWFFSVSNVVSAMKDGLLRKEGWKLTNYEL